MAKYWIGSLPDKDDFGDKYRKVMIDGRTKYGTWANMTEASWIKHGIGVLGTGCGQRYEKQFDGLWLKIEE